MVQIGKRVAALSMALMVLTGCSSGEDKKAAGPAPTTALAGPTTTVRPVDTSFTGQNSAQFCALAKSYTDRFANVGAATTAAELRTVVGDARTAINATTAAAPAELKADAQVLANALGNVFTELEKVNFDTTKLTVASFASLQTKEFETSTTRFNGYLRSVCGFTG